MPHHEYDVTNVMARQKGILVVTYLTMGLILATFFFSSKFYKCPWESRRSLPLRETLIGTLRWACLSETGCMIEKACMKKISDNFMLYFVYLGAWKEATLGFLIHAMLNKGRKPK